MKEQLKTKAMKKYYILILSVFTTTFSWQANAQNGGDSCEDALAVTPGIYNDVAIVVGSGGASHDADAADALWYLYTPSSNGTMSINSCASDPSAIDTRLWIYLDGCNTLTPVADDDDGCEAPNTFGSVLADIPVIAGQEYLIEWYDRWGADAFDWELIFTPPPTGGINCADATPVSPGTFSDVFIINGSGGATQADATDALWYSYTPIESGTININSCASDPTAIDTRLNVYTDGCETLTPVADDDDGCEAPNGFGSILIAVDVIGGEEYLIEWDDRWGEAPFDWELTFSPEGFNDSCQTALEVTCNSSIEGTTLDKTDTNGVGGADAFYKYTETSTEARDVAFSLCTAFDYDPFMRIYIDCNGTLVSDNDDACGLGSEITLTTMPATTYYIAIEGYNGDTGTFTLTVDCAAPPMPPPNDLIVNAIDIGVVDYLDENVNTQFATEEGGNPSNCTIDGFNGVWYSFYSAEGGTSTASILAPNGVNSVIYFEAINDTPSIEELVRVEDVLNPCFTGTQASISLVPEKYYFLLVTNSGEVTDIEIETEVILGTEGAVFENFTFFPNPTTGTVTLKNTTAIEKVILRNLLGAIVLEAEINAIQTTINTELLATGSYILSVFADGLSSQHYILKE